MCVCVCVHVYLYIHVCESLYAFPPISSYSKYNTSHPCLFIYLYFGAVFVDLLFFICCVISHILRCCIFASILHNTKNKKFTEELTCF